jgi:hypothetical protein
MDSERCELTPNETRILKLVQGFYGDQNRLQDVVFHGEDAALFVRDVRGVTGQCVNLTFLAALHAEGTSLSAIRDEYLVPHARPVRKPWWRFW